MKILADECCDANLVIGLRASAYDVKYVSESNPGISDKEVLEIALDEKRLLLTEDKDFGELAVRFGYKTLGIILLRLPDVRSHNLIDKIIRWFKKYSNRFTNHFTVITEKRLRIRKLPDHS